MKKMIPIRIPMPPKYDEVSYVDKKVMEEVVNEVNSRLTMTPHKALDWLYMEASYGSLEKCETIKQYKVVYQALNRLQELEIVNERLEKEIREVLKK